MLTQRERELFEGQQKLLTEVLGKLTALPDGLRQSLADHLWADIPSTVEEWGYQPNGVTVTAPPTVAGIRRITSAIAYTPTTNATQGNQTGYITLGTGGHFIPVSAGLSIITPISAVLQEGELGSLTLGTPQVAGATPGLLVLALFGTQLPRYGQLAGG